MTTLPEKQRARQATPSLDRFAELLSREIKPADAAELMGLNRRRGCTMLRNLCERLGPQAV